MTSRRMSGNGGFTLVEVLAAVLLLSIGLLAVLSAGSLARQTQQQALYMSIGRNAAQTAIERVRSSGSYTLSSSTVSGLPRGNSISLTKAAVTGAHSVNITRASVTVSWPERNSTRKVYYETYISPK